MQAKENENLNLAIFIHPPFLDEQPLHPLNLVDWPRRHGGRHDQHPRERRGRPHRRKRYLGPEGCRHGNPTR